MNNIEIDTHLRSSFFWDIRASNTSYRHFGATYHTHLQGSHTIPISKLEDTPLQPIAPICVVTSAPKSNLPNLLRIWIARNDGFDRAVCHRIPPWHDCNRDWRHVSMRASFSGGKAHDGNPSPLNIEGQVFMICGDSREVVRARCAVAFTFRV